MRTFKMKPIVIKKEFHCTCEQCERGRRFYRNIDKLPKKEREWMDNLYNYFFEIEAELDMQRAHEADKRKRKR